MNDADRLELPHVIPDGKDIFSEVRGPGGYFDRSGNAISFRDWARLSAWDEKDNNNQYRIVKQEEVGDYWISTVWLGLDHGFGRSKPLIFETMVFNNVTDESDLDCRRWSTEEQALAGHEAMVDEVRLIVEATRKE